MGNNEKIENIDNGRNYKEVKKTAQDQNNTDSIGARARDDPEDKKVNDNPGEGKRTDLGQKIEHNIGANAPDDPEDHTGNDHKMGQKTHTEPGNN